MDLAAPSANDGPWGFLVRNCMPICWAIANTRSAPVVMERLDRGDVERQLERQPHPQRAALVAIEVGGRVAAPEVGGHVHEHRRRGEGLRVDARDVVEGLERRAGLAPAQAQHVVLGLELLVDACGSRSSSPSRRRRGSRRAGSRSWPPRRSRRSGRAGSPSTRRTARRAPWRPPAGSGAVGEEGARLDPLLGDLLESVSRAWW